MSANENFGFQSTKAYRKTNEYAEASRHHRRGILKLIFSLIAIAVPAFYFAVAVQLEHRFLPLWSVTIGFYIFMFGLVGAAIIIPLFFRILQCPFTYWKLFLGIAASLGFGYLIQMLVLHLLSLDPSANQLLAAEIIAGVQALTCTVFAVLGVNRNLWSQTHDKKRKKEVRYAYQRFEMATAADPVDIMSVQSLAESDYSFAVEYMKKKSATEALYTLAKQGAAAGSIPQDEYRKLILAAAANGSLDAAVDCATSIYIAKSESELIKMSTGDKTYAKSLLTMLEEEAETNTSIRPLAAILRSRLRSSMILTSDDVNQNMANLVKSSEEMKELVATCASNKTVVKEAKRALDFAEEAIQRLLQYQNSER